jgi:hypothetical protein
MPVAGTHEMRWRSRPLEATLVRIVAFAVPFAAALTASAAFVQLVARPPTLSVWVWRALAVGIATATGLGVDPIARRLLPLAALLQMSLLFPDRAPSRLALGLQSRSTGDLQRLLAADLSNRSAAEAAEHVLSLVAALSRHDRITRGHSERVWGYARLLGTELDLSQDDADRLQWVALLHDVGKLAVAPEILNKRGRLTAAEWAEIRTHPTAGAQLVAPLAEWLGPWADAVAQHHERFDGAGYPNRIEGTDICLGARIVAVIDTYDVITSGRSYKRPVTSRQARAELLRCAGTQFDPEIVDAFVNITTGRIRYAAGPLAGVAQLPLISSVAQTGASVSAAATAAAIPTATAAAMTGLLAVAPAAAVAAPRATSPRPTPSTPTTVVVAPPHNVVYFATNAAAAAAAPARLMSPLAATTTIDPPVDGSAPVAHRSAQTAAPSSAHSRGRHEQAGAATTAVHRHVAGPSGKGKRGAKRAPIAVSATVVVTPPGLAKQPTPPTHPNKTTPPGQAKKQ